ncbi:MAG: hypothetical protein ACC656_07405, partial [Candidatus Heimdallarchaeota archaeon]
FDTQKMTAGVYRNGIPALLSDSSVKLYKEGRTASVSITDYKTVRTIRTNGKPDASINLDLNGESTGDEPTMTLCAILGMLYNPGAKNVVNIGMGSGLTSETILAFPDIKTLQTIEIEPVMIEAAKMFAPVVTKPFIDSRSKFVITDAKSHFASSKNKYDIIFSEPSNPWVSGIAGLFSVEFYKIAAYNLSNDGLLIQWLHLYETNEKIVASVIKALSMVMSDYAIYTSNGGDIIIVSKKSNKLGKLSANIFNNDEIVKILNKSGISSISDIRMLKVGEKSYLDSYMKSITAPINSDFFPYVDQNAVKARYLKSNSVHFTKNILTALPYVEILDRKYTKFKYKSEKLNPKLKWHSKKISKSIKLFDLIRYSRTENNQFDSNDRYELDAFIVNQALKICSSRTSIWFESFKKVLLNIVPYIEQEKLISFLIQFKKSECFNTLSPQQITWIELLIAQTERNTKKIYILSEKLLAVSPTHRGYLLASFMLSGIAENKYANATLAWEKYEKQVKLQDKYASLIKIFYIQ